MTYLKLQLTLLCTVSYFAQPVILQGSDGDWKTLFKRGKPGKIGEHFPVREKSGNFN